MQQEWMRTNLNGNNISVIMPLRQMLAQHPNMTYSYACEAYKKLLDVGACTQDEFKTNYEQLALYGVAMSGLIFGYNVETGKLNLYTASYSLLNKMACKAMLKQNKEPLYLEIDKLKELYVKGSRLKNSVKKNGVLQLVRLDVEYTGGKPYFVPRIPRSQVDYIDGEVLFTYQALETAMTYMNKMLQTKVVLVTSGDDSKIVTKNVSVLAKLYGEERANYLIRDIFDARVNQFLVPCLGKSIYSSGLTNINLLTIDKMEEVLQLNTESMPDLYVSDLGAREFFKASINGLDDATVIEYGKQFMDIGGITINAQAYRDFLMNEYANTHSRKRLYRMIKESPSIFDFEKYKKYSNKFGSNYMRCEIPKSREELGTLLHNDVYKISLITSKGFRTDCICTNNMNHLVRIFGQDYFAKYESEGNRLRALKSAISQSSEGVVTLRKFTDLCNQYGLGYLLKAISINGVAEDTQLSTQDIEGIILRGIQDVSNRATTVKNPALVIARSCEAYMTPDGTVKDLYKNINIESIKEFVKLT